MLTVRSKREKLKRLLRIGSAMSKDHQGCQVLLELVLEAEKGKEEVFLTSIRHGAEEREEPIAWYLASRFANAAEKEELMLKAVRKCQLCCSRGGVCSVSGEERPRKGHQIAGKSGV